MANPPKNEAKEVELEPDAWERFERFIKKAAKTPPKHRTAKITPTKKGGDRGKKANKPR